ncbi:hypothetical protein PAECIP111893_04779 [Paenibacillus plantiphilus]|uniref:Hemerythrin-like domain-containing protein n=1 Tax=Paenibacillus plantiphilus TaxID=2905650 RepID=A0ABN8GY08_9BACL|nr:hemerythrin domain-containing protein [Paenibacillus plantiphilus]CAH1221807.1 hypothetical protein PAECIP111893_04779 [Paenibacillus plantiphilus]
MHKAMVRRRREELPHPSELIVMLGQLRKEHIELRFMIERIEWAADGVERMVDVLAAANELRELKASIREFMEKLEQHAAWEEETLLPFINEYFRRSYNHRIDDSIWTMEKDHEMGRMYMEQFLRRVSEIDAHPNAGMVAEAVRCLLQGCVLLREHLRIEEQIVFPLAEGMLSGSSGLK